ncbi:MAG: hypothetical protein ACTSR8_02810 [Promethearchaeota archaeon]
MRISTNAYEKGFNSLKLLGTILIRLFKAELPIIKNAQVTLYTDPKKIEEPHANAMDVYGARDERARGLHDEDVDMYYGCVYMFPFRNKAKYVKVLPPRMLVASLLTELLYVEV